MLNIRTVLSFLDERYVLRYLNTLLLLAFIPFLDCFLLAQTSVFIGKYLLMAVLLFTSLAGFFLSYHMLRKNLLILKRNNINNYYSDYFFNMLPGTLLVAFLLIMPGIIGSVFGLILSIPLLRYKAGRYLSNFLKIEWKEIHEYINIID